MITESPSKWKQVESEVRRLIASGKWKAGERLPTYDELELRFKVSRITLQQVMRHLKQDGFITSLERQGLFVSKNPPHLGRIGLVIPRDENEVRYWREFVMSARTVAAQARKEVIVYRNLENSPETERQLRRDVDNHMLSGVIFLNHIAAGSPGHAVYSDPSVPKVVSTAGSSARLAMRLMLNEPLMVKRALDYLQEQGCSRIALFSNIGPEISRIFDNEVKRRNFYSPAKWRFNVALLNLELAEKIAHLLMCFPEKERPDGIFISDDNLTSAVIKGIASTRLRIPEDISIVSHYNWSAGIRDHLQVKSIGFDLKALMRKLFDAFDSCRKTGRMPEILEVPPVFEEELSENHIKNKEVFNEKAIYSYLQAQ